MCSRSPPAVYRIFVVHFYLVSLLIAVTADRSPDIRLSVQADTMASGISFARPSSRYSILRFLEERIFAISAERECGYFCGVDYR